MKLRAAFILGTLLALPLPHLALGQGTPVYQDGPMVPGHLSKFLTNGRIGDAGVGIGDASNLVVAPIVPSNVDLIATSTATAPNGVWRLDFAAGNGAPPLFYRPSTAACPLNAGNGDGGSQVKSTDGKCWLAAFGATYDVRQWGAKADDGATDSTAAINTALVYASTVGGAVDLGGKGYGVCNVPVHMVGGGKRVNLRNGYIGLQTGCAAAPQEVLLNEVAPTNSYAVSPALEDLTIDGKCTTKYVYRIHGGNQTTHKNVLVYNPAPNATIAGSIGVYIDGGFEVKFGSSNWVVAAAPCYNSGNLPQTGIYHTNGGNADFTGVIVINFTTGINAGGDDYFGPGTHVWGGCALTGGGCTYNAALRTSTGIILNGTGTAIGVEIDDPANTGVALQSQSAFDRMIAIGNSCAFSATPTSAQSCVAVTTNTVGSVVMGTGANNIAQVFPNNVVLEQAGVGATNTISSNPGASIYEGDAPVIDMFGVAASISDGCIGQNGYRAGATACTGAGWLTPPTTGCRVSSLTAELTVAPGVGNTIKLTVQDNGVDTPLSVSLTGTGVPGTRATNNALKADIPVGDVITLRVQATAGAPPNTEVRAAVYGCG